MRTLVIEEEDLKLIGQRVETALVEGDDRHAIDDAGVRDIAEIVHVYRANGLTAEVPAGKFLTADFNARLETFACGLFRIRGGGEREPEPES